MTHPDLIERITRSLAYMLRHQPEQFDLELDEFGWADLREVVRALNERLGEAVSEEDVQDAVSSGDRQRYEIDRGMIRALYGHSIDVQPGEPSQPPELLYVGVSRQDAERAERSGLRPGRRRFLHLALTSEDALETAARSSEDVVLVKVHALDAWEEGISFYDRKALFLSDPIPTQYLEISEVAPREESFAGAHAGPAESFTEEAPAASETGGPADAPRGYAPRGPGDGGGQRRRGRRGGRGRGRDFGDDRRPPSGEPVQERGPDRGAPSRPYDDRPRQPQQVRDDRPRQGYGGGGGGAGGGPRHGGGAPRPAHSGGGHGGGYRSEQGGPRGGGGGGGGGGFRDDRGRGGFRDDRPRHDAPRQDAPRHDGPRHDAPRHEAPRHEAPRHEQPRRDDRGPAPEREAWQRRDERRPAPPPPPPRSEPAPAPPAPVVEPPKRPARPARRESNGDGGFGAGL